MLFPVPKLWSENGVDNAVAKIDRHLADRTQRLSLGLSVSSDFKSVDGTLLVTRGRGKYMRVNHAASIQDSVPESISCSFQQLASNPGSSFNDLAQAQSDLAEIQAQTIERIKSQAGKYVDRLLIVGVADPGYWSSDFDGQIFYSSLCAPHRLAELSGLNVIDGFPVRDLAVGGSGAWLQALPLWFLLADRDPRVSRNNTALFRFNADTDIYLLPPSDGLDAEIPDIGCLQLPGLSFIRKLAGTLSPTSNAAKIDLVGLYVDGKRIEGLVNLWNSQFQDPANRIGARPVRGSGPTWDEDKLIVTAQKYLSDNAHPLSSIIRSAFAFIVESIKEHVENRGPRAVSGAVQLDRIWISAERDSQAAAINQVRQIFEGSEIETTTSIGITASALSATSAALMGLMHVDQLASNIPWLSGAESMRTLGQLTAGRPSNWRQLIMDMADFQPPAMKLRDAV